MSVGDYYRTGTQDCRNVFSIDEFDASIEEGGTPEQIVDRVLDGDAFQEEESWIEQQEFTEGEDPHEAFEAWKSGWRSCAISAIGLEIERRKEETDAFYLFSVAPGCNADEPIDRFATMLEAIEELVRIGSGAVYSGSLNGPDYPMASLCLGRMAFTRNFTHASPESYRRLRELADVNDPPFRLQMVGAQDIGPVSRSKWKDNPPLEPLEIARRFRDLLADTDPSTVAVAEDLLLENHVTLADISLDDAKRLPLAAREGNEPLWSAGVFILPPGNEGGYGDPSNPLGSTLVAWTVRQQLGIADKPIQRYRASVWITFRDVTWRVPQQFKPRGTHELAIREAVEVAWRAVRVLKRRLGAAVDDVRWLGFITADKPPIPPMLLEPVRFEAAREIVDPINPECKACSTPGRYCDVHMEPTENPAWTTNALADAFESLASQIPPSYMPKLAGVRGGPKNTLVAELKEYGCGAYGCVLPTLDDHVVLKVTTDPTEAEFASQLAADLVAPICVEYYLAVSLAATHKGLPVFVLWRESADDVGAVAKVLGDHAADLVHQQHRAAQAVFSAFHDDDDPAELEKLVATWKRACRAMGRQNRELDALATGMLEVFERQQIFFGDIHEGNLGRVFRGGRQAEWVITDPGHVAVIQ